MKLFLTKYRNALFFIGGFLFDAFTLNRIDSFLDLSLQAIYLAVISLLLILSAQQESGRWTPSGIVAKAWAFEEEILHFLYGGLLSAYVIFYFKSASFTRSLLFLILVAFLMIANELPRIRKTGSLMRLGLYAFCVVSFLNYLFPILAGVMGWPIFLVAWLAGAGVTFVVVRKIISIALPSRAAIFKLGGAPAAVLLLIFSLYFTKLIPPVPLSVQYMGIYHSVEKVNDRYRLVYRKPPFYRFWQKHDRVFLAKPEDRIYCFVRIFAPRRFRHRVFVRWDCYNESAEVWTQQERIPIAISGGRDQGFRGYVAKDHYSPGFWRVEVETEDGRILGGRRFEVRKDLSSTFPKLKALWM